MKRRNELLRCVCLAAVVTGGLASPARAQGWQPSSFFVQGGVGEDRVQAAAVGVQWPWAWRANALGGELSVQTELFVALWRARAAAGGRENFQQLGLVPVLRYRFGDGRSPWFLEGGIGVSVTNKRFDTRDKTFSTNWNFSDNLAFGRSFGEQARHEVSLRLQHTSNGGLKKPNPGLNLVMLRYAAAF
ncbi:acyloxyacyl hydrolase [Ramlibacter henchirensis]|uniref:Lipid A deacylase n=1 Tax=Ramlibacter henchirensis TaxID=204072 RepID=A0A4Z0C4U6_9BURK|nr:acyloxyacyl hydrolase [Ramlibacter henchirensis]TFZ06757.1 acyloxyacyl hydrolase [Ramlibacter henchirensis]